MFCLMSENNVQYSIFPFYIPFKYIFVEVGGNTVFTPVALAFV